MTEVYNNYLDPLPGKFMITGGEVVTTPPPL